MMTSNMLDGAEVARHNTSKSCWIVIDGKVYDVTGFLRQHPGGGAILLRQGGADATSEFAKVHPLDYVNELPEGSYVGPLAPKTSASLNSPKPTPAQEVVATDELPHVSLCVTTGDFEAPAKSVLPHRFWTFVTSSANSGLSYKGNADDWSRIRFRPRVLRDVGAVDTRRSVLGHKSQVPFYFTAVGTIGNIHPGAEPEAIRAIVRKGVHQMVSTASTKTLEDIMDSYHREQDLVGSTSPSVLFFQLYLPTDRDKGIAIIKRAKEAGYKGIWLTVDTPVLGKRTADRRLQAIEAVSAGLAQEEELPVKGPAGSENSFAPAYGGRPVPGQLSPHTVWEDLKWIREAFQGPIVLKGIQCAEDAKLAMESGCEGILLSNHGGRQLHSAPSALMTLLEIRSYCPEVLDKLEVYVDGGLRDGADVLKAICLGATAVGVGRSYLYALAAYGSRGMERCTEILAEELSTAMKLVGITSLDQARPEMVNATALLNEMWRPDALLLRSRL